MKKPPEAIRADAGLLGPRDFDRIRAAVEESFRQAQERAEEAGRAPAAKRQVAAEPSPSTNNMEGKTLTGADTVQLILEDGQIKQIPARRGWGGSSAFVDWINYTAHEEAYMRDFEGEALLNPDDVVKLISAACHRIFGFGILAERPTGANFYRRSFVLGEGCGMVCYGGQRHTVLVMLSGAGCAAAKPGWEQRLHDWLEGHRNQCARITRIDLAHDVFGGEQIGPTTDGTHIGYSVDAANADFDAGLFSAGGRMPDCEHRGNWKRPNGKGRTFYVGHRANGKFARIYEKGRELGDKSSEWTRIEVELKSVDRIIPFDVLLKAGEYLAATYPAFAWISEHQERIFTEQKKAEVTYDSMMAWLKRQCGAALNVARAIEGSAEAALSKIVRDEIPSRLKVPSHLYGGEWLHERTREVPSLSVSVAAW